jgi:hypothetical protein
VYTGYGMHKGKQDTEQIKSLQIYQPDMVFLYIHVRKFIIITYL